MRRLLHLSLLKFIDINSNFRRREAQTKHTKKSNNECFKEKNEKKSEKKRIDFKVEKHWREHIALAQSNFRNQI